MTGVVFVHGTGVREPGYGESLQKVTTELTALRPDVTLVPCYWGGDFGTRLHQHGESVPTYDTTRRTATSVCPSCGGMSSAARSRSSS